MSDESDFQELTRSLCPECRRVIDAKVVLRDGAVFMHKRCPDHRAFEARVYGDSEAYLNFARFNRPGTAPVAYSTDINHGCPHDCGLCPDHQQHACVGIIEVNSACDMDCPLCFAEAGVQLGRITLPPGVDLDEARRVRRSAADAVQRGVLGYALVTARRP